MTETIDADRTGLSEGIVVRVDAQYPVVECGGRRFRCAVRKKLKHGFKAHIKRVCVGDRVKCAPPARDDELGAIEEVLARKTQLVRSAAGREGYQQVVAANVDRLLVVVATKLPDLHPRLIDRMLVAGEKGELDCVIVVNKTDLADPAKTRASLDYYPEIGYPVILTSATRGDGIDELREALKDRSSVIAGPSGAGKSSLLNVIQPGLRLTTREVSGTTGKGKHTTSFVQLLPLDFGGYVVDTPGIREFGLWDIEKRELAGFFPEMTEYIGSCKFSDCTHIHEPDCAIKAAVEAGKIARERYESYKHLFASLKVKDKW